MGKPTLVVPKPGSDKLRFTVDLRAIKKLTVPVARSMPDMDSMCRSVVGGNCFAKIDLCHAYWQVPLHENSQEIMSIQIPLGVYAPTRILQGSTDAKNDFQSVTALAFTDMQANMLQRLADFLLHADNEQNLLSAIRCFFLLLAKSGGLRFTQVRSPFLQVRSFGGRKLDSEGMVYNPRHLSTLRSMLDPGNAAELQQFLCAANWMRGAIPNFSTAVAPLHDVLEDVTGNQDLARGAVHREFPLTGYGGSAITLHFQASKT